MIRNILFDLDDTLLDFHMAEKIALKNTLLHLGIKPKEEFLTRYSEINLAQWRMLEQGKLTRSQVKLRRYKILFDEIGADCSFLRRSAMISRVLDFLITALPMLTVFAKRKQPLSGIA